MHFPMEILIKTTSEKCMYLIFKLWIFNLIDFKLQNKKKTVLYAIYNYY